MKKVPVNLRIRADLIKRLRENAKAVKVPYIQFLEELLEEHLDAKTAQHAKAAIDAATAKLSSLKKPKKGTH